MIHFYPKFPPYYYNLGPYLTGDKSGGAGGLLPGGGGGAAQVQQPVAGQNVVVAQPAAQPVAAQNPPAPQQ